MAARILQPVVRDAPPTRGEDMAVSFVPPPEVVDRAAWTRFCALVADGAGVDDRVERASAAPGKASRAFFRKEVMRVDHHRRNTVPFLLEACALRGRSVLEFGSGTAGLSVAMVAGGVRRVTAAEPIFANCEAGVSRVRAYGLDASIHACHAADTARLPFASGVFEAVVCSSVLQYVSDPARRETLLAEMLRVLAPGGLLVVCNSGNGLIPGGPHSSRWWSNLLPGRAARRGHNRGVTWWELRRALAPLGAASVRGRGAVARWRARALGGDGGSSLAKRTLLAGYGVLENTICPHVGVPVEALLPYPELTFRKAGAVEGRAPRRG